MTKKSDFGGEAENAFCKMTPEEIWHITYQVYCETVAERERLGKWLDKAAEPVQVRLAGRGKKTIYAYSEAEVDTFRKNGRPLAAKKRDILKYHIAAKRFLRHDIAERMGILTLNKKIEYLMQIMDKLESKMNAIPHTRRRPSIHDLLSV